MKSITVFLRIGIIGIALGIILGAFGAHSLKNVFTQYEMDIWNKGIFYQITNCIGLILIIILIKINLIKESKLSMGILTIGIIFFSGSLYTIALSNIFLDTNHLLKTLMIPITPIGGSLIIISWLILLFKIKK
tara:strand:+ start:127 stop:525 length:399 start_codon:yes stop_codon:yes gene_type:complete